MNKKTTLNDIFNDDDFGLLDSKPEISRIKSEEDRLVDSFEEINIFIDNNNREPNTSSMSEYGMSTRLRHFKEDETNKKILKPFDRYNLLGYVEMEKPTIEDVFNDDDFGLLAVDNESNIFKFKHTPNSKDRAETDFVAKRIPIKDKEFKPYEAMFHEVHQQLKSGQRKLQRFDKTEKSLQAERFYLLDGVLLYLESVSFDRKNSNLGKNTSRRNDGRTKIIFENATSSNMLYRSLSKALYNNGNILTELDDSYNQELFVDVSAIKKEDTRTGWIYILKSKSNNPKISSIENLYKIGFSSTLVEERIKNAKHEATYLFSDVSIVTTYKIYNRNANKLEGLLHRFFADVCLDIDLFDDKDKRITPREWFIVPFEIIDGAISLIINENIVNYKYDSINKKIKLKTKML